MNIIDMIDLEIEKRSLLKHPFYQMWSEGKLTLENLQGYSKEYFQLVKAVPGMVDSVAAGARDQLADSIAANTEEERQHVPLWSMFANSLGVSQGELEQNLDAPMTNEAVRSMLDLCKLPLHEAAAAMYAYEAQLPKISRSKIDGLVKFYNLSSEDATKYFEVHEEADVRHAQLWREILLGAPEEKHAALIESAIMSLEAQNTLLDSVQERYVNSIYC